MTLYDLLGVSPDASTSDVRRAYVTLARRHHPDRPGGDARAMRAANDAWATLRDPGRRALYDQSLQQPRTIPVAMADPVFRTDAEDLLADLADDTPLGGTVVLPRWMSLLPVAMFASSMGAIGVGLLFASAPAIGVAVALFAVSCAMFLAAPFVALLSSRRPGSK